MNTWNGTGWLQKDAWTATVPGTFHRRVLFDLMLQPDGDEPAPWRCEIDDEALGARVEAKLVSGAGLIVRGELHTRPFEKHGVREGFVRYIRVDRVEFSRLPVAAEQPEAAVEV